jgi:hypothetical protein
VIGGMSRAILRGTTALGPSRVQHGSSAARVAKAFTFGFSLPARSCWFGRVAEWFKAAVLKTPCGRADPYRSVLISAVYRGKLDPSSSPDTDPCRPVLTSSVANPVATDEFCSWPEGIIEGLVVFDRRIDRVGCRRCDHWDCAERPAASASVVIAPLRDMFLMALPRLQSPRAIARSWQASLLSASEDRCFSLPALPR